MRPFVVVLALLFSALTASAMAEDVVHEAAVRPAYLDKAGVVRWQDNNEEVALFGANYCIMSGSDYRMAGLVSKDRKAMIDEDMAQFARMGWTALRLCSWGDWENSDRDGNLIVNDHVDLMDYLIAKARERGIYILLTPIHTYNPSFADQVDKPSQNTGFSRYYERTEMGTNPRSIAAQANYIGQLLNHMNPYTGVALKDEPALLFIEVINEPVHHPEDIKGSVGYIDALVKAVRDTGCKKITFFNVSQDFRIAEAIKQSNVDGVSFGWYPSGLVAGRTDRGNFLQAVDSYPDMLRQELNGKPRIVYEFDTADLATGYMYPAMARTYRSVGAQFASMFAYDMLGTAPYNLGWQTHFLNLVHSPRKAVSAIIAAEAMRRLPRFKSYGRYPENRSFGDFRVSYEDDMSELVAPDAYMNAGATNTPPRDAKTLTRIVGFGSSPLVSYEGTGAYFLDKVRDGVWRLEICPDEILVRDPFEQPRPDKIVSRLLYRNWPMQIALPDLGRGFTATPIKVPRDPVVSARQADDGKVAVEPGIWLLSANAHVDRASLPARIDRVGFDEYHVNDPLSYPDDILFLAPAEFLAGNAIEIRVRVADTALPDAVKLWVRRAGARSFGSAIPMMRVQGNDYRAIVDPGKLTPGLYEYVASATTGNRSTTFPGAVPQQPGEWPFQNDSVWTFRVTPPGAPLRLLDPKLDYPQLQFVRPHETVRNGLFDLVPGEDAGEFALSLSVPDLGADTPDRYAAALYIGDAIGARGVDATHGDSLHVKLKSLGGARKTVDISLIEKDGTAWRVPVVAKSGWADVSVPLGDLKISRSILIPTPFPGLWDYWRESPAARGKGGDRIHVENVERLELTVHRNAGDWAAENGRGVAIESVRLTFAGEK
jgi:hypothetical protein